MAKRINTQFLVLLTSVVGALLLVVVGVFGYRRFFNRDPQKFIALGEKEFLAGSYDNALNNYGKAIRLRRGDPELLVRYGEIVDYTVAQHHEALDSARSAWRQALVTDPANVPALQHLMDSYLEEMLIRPSPSVYPRVHEYAGKLAVADPTNRRAKAYEHIATILQSQNGVATTPAALASAMTDLEAQAKADPGDADILFYLARGKLQSALDLLKNNDPDKAHAVMAALLELTNHAVKVEAQSAAIQWRAAAIYIGLAGLDSANATSLRAQANAALVAAHTNVKPTDAHFVDIETSLASSLFEQKKSTEGGALLRSIYNQSPGDPVARIQLARYLASQPASRQEAVDLLSKPITAQGLKGVRAAYFGDREAQRLYELTMVQVELCNSTDDPVRRKALLENVDGSYKAFANVAKTDSVPALRLLGMIQSLKNDNIEAVATFHRALNTLQRNGESDPELLLQAGRVDLQAGQNGSAEKLFQQYINGNPKAFTPRVELMAMYLDDGNFDDAQRVLNELDRLQPDSSDVATLHVGLLTAQKNAAAAKPYYDKLPEKVSKERRAEAKLAMNMKDFGETARLLEMVRAASPGDIRVSLALAQAYASLDQKDKAAAVIRDAIKLKPADPSLLLMQKQLANATPKELQELVDRLTGGTDEFSKNLKNFQLALGKEQFDEAAADLDAANKLKPDNKTVHQSYFQLYLAQRQFDKAAAELPILSHLNADDADGLIFRTRLALAQQNFPEAVRNARNLVDRRPDFAESYVQLAQALQASGRMDEAEREYEHALDHQSNNFDALKGAAEVTLRLQRSDKANDFIKRGLQVFPNSTAFREMSLNYDLIYSTHPETAVNELAKLSAASPEDATMALALAKAAIHVAQVQRNSDPARSKQLMATADATLKKGVAKWPEDPQFSSLLADELAQGGDIAGGEKVLTDFVNRPEQKKSIQGWRNLADYYQATRQMDKYEAALRTAMPLSAKNLDITQRLAMAQVQKGDVDGALATLKGLNDSRAVQERVQILIAAHRGAEAEAEIKGVLANNSNAPELSNMLASLYLDERRFDEARDIAKNNVAANPSDNTALYIQAQIELRRPGGDLSVAAKSLNAIKLHAPDDMGSRLAMAEVYRRTNRPEAEVQELEDLVQLKPLNREPRLRLLAAYATGTPPDWIHYDKLTASSIAQFPKDATWPERQAAGLSARRQYAQAVASLRSAIQLDPQSQELKLQLLKNLLSAKDYPTTIQEADRLLAGDKKPWWALYSRGVARAASDKKAGIVDLDAALANANAAKDRNAAQAIVSGIAASIGFDEALQRIAAQPQDANWRLTTAQIYVQKQDYAAAVKAAGAVRDDTSSAVTSEQKQLALRLIAENSQTAKQFDVARTNYMKLLELAPNDLLALNNLAYMLATDMQDPQSAKPLIQHAYQMSKKEGAFPMISDTYGWVMTLLGGADARVGLDTLTSVVDLNPDFLDARYHLGVAMLRNNQSATARTHLQKALDQINFNQKTQPSYRTELKALIVAALDKAGPTTGQTTLPAAQ